MVRTRGQKADAADDTGPEMSKSVLLNSGRTSRKRAACALKDPSSGNGQAGAPKRKPANAAGSDDSVVSAGASHYAKAADAAEPPARLAADAQLVAAARAVASAADGAAVGGANAAADAPTAATIRSDDSTVSGVPNAVSAPSSQAVANEPSLDVVGAADSPPSCHSPAVAAGSPGSPRGSTSEVVCARVAAGNEVTETMREEERKLAEQRHTEDEQEHKQAQKKWDAMSNDLKEERFRKLQLLLTKSSLYTSYLVKRIRGQGDNPSSSTVQHAGKKTDNSVTTPVLFTGGSLRKYQLDGLLWLNALYENGVNGILADEMGLGKTVQCIAAISHLVSMNVGGPYLIVAPLSTLPNWVSEFQHFAPLVPVLMYHGTKDERMTLRHKIRRIQSVDGKYKTQPVVVTSYEISMRDRKEIMGYHWKYLIVDEGHRIKNAQCRLTRELRMYNTTHRLLLTGTPLQNNLAELWSLLNFLLPEIFDDLESFESWFQLESLGNEGKDQLIAEERKRNILSMLHQILTPFLLRRLKNDVDLKIPPKKELIVPAHMTADQKSLYQSLVDKSIQGLSDPPKAAVSAEIIEKDALGRPVRKAKQRKINYARMMESRKDEKDDDDSLDEWLTSVLEPDTAARHESSKSAVKLVERTPGISLKNILMQLRKICNHPYLISFPVNEETGWYNVDESLVEASGKMQVLDRLLRKLQARQHRVLLFSQMTRMLDIIEDFCQLREYKYCRLDGSTHIDDRRCQIGSFNKESEYFIFLLSTRAGGLGINLSTADTVIIYDSDWNPQGDLQAQDRCHRIGQNRPVVVYRLICPGTVDEKMVERASLKRRLEQMVIHKEKFKMGLHVDSFSDSMKPLSADELLKLIKDTDYQRAGCGQGLISHRELEALVDRSDLIKEWERMCKSDNAVKGTAAAAAAAAASDSGSSAGFGTVFDAMERAAT